MVKRIAVDALFIPQEEAASNRFLLKSCKRFCACKATRIAGEVGVLVVGKPTFIKKIEAAFKL